MSSLTGDMKTLAHSEHHNIDLRLFDQTETRYDDYAVTLTNPRSEAHGAIVETFDYIDDAIKLFLKKEAVLGMDRIDTKHELEYLLGDGDEIEPTAT